MKIDAMPQPVQELIRPLVDAGIEVWLMGSRANGGARMDSDWDLMVFGDEAMLKALANKPPLDGLDLLVVYDGERFRSPWRNERIGDVHSGDLGQWKWRVRSAIEAEYEGTKLPDDWGSPRRAERIES